MSFPVPAATYRVEYRQSNSVFLATIAPAPTMEAAREFIHTIRAEMPDATHHVYAFVVGHGASVTEGMSDDGEPTGTSGPPALAVLRGSGLGDAVLVITRYFGGTKLGTGGLVTAYKAAAKLAVESVPRSIKIPRTRFAVEVPYPLYERLRQYTEAHAGVVEQESFGEGVALTIAHPTAGIADLQQWLADASQGRITAIPIE